MRNGLGAWVWVWAQLSLGLAAGAPLSSAAEFTVSPIDAGEVRQIIPLGNLNPQGGHVFPTDHVYFDYEHRANPAVRAPASGTVFAVIDQSLGDLKIEVRVDQHLCYYLGHLFLDPGVEIGSRLTAGQVLGRVSGRSMLDLGAYDDRVRLPGLINPGRYPVSTVQAVSPLAKFAEPLRSQLYAKVTREGADKDGKIDFDQPGRLVGNWFHESLATQDSSRGTPEVWRLHLAFVYDVRQPKAVRIGIGGRLAPTGTYRIPPEAPDPADVGPESGLVKYRLLGPVETEWSKGGAEPNGAAGPGLLLVQLLDGGRLKVEFCPSRAPSDVQGFSHAALVYVR